jgi:hypothetical protein
VVAVGATSMLGQSRQSWLGCAMPITKKPNLSCADSFLRYVAWFPSGAAVFVGLDLIGNDLMLLVHILTIVGIG